VIWDVAVLFWDHLTSALSVIAHDILLKILVVQLYCAFAQQESSGLPKE
jgi:hypothetical protein